MKFRASMPKEFIKDDHVQVVFSVKQKSGARFEFVGQIPTEKAKLLIDIYQTKPQVKP